MPHLALIRTETGEVLETFPIDGLRQVEIIGRIAQLRHLYGCDDPENGLDVVEQV